MPSFHALRDADGRPVVRGSDGRLRIRAGDPEGADPALIAATDDAGRILLVEAGGLPLVLHPDDGSADRPAPVLAALSAEPTGTGTIRLRLGPGGFFLSEAGGVVGAGAQAEAADATPFRLFPDAVPAPDGSVARLPVAMRFDRDGLSLLLSAADPATFPVVAALLPFLSAVEVRDAWTASRPSAGRDAFFVLVRDHGRRHLRRFEAFTADLLRSDADRFGWAIGGKSYGKPRIIEAGRGRLTIGRYCSMAEPCIVLGNHRTSSASSYPFLDLWTEWPGTVPGMSDHVSRDVRIGSDVWIGVGATILPGAVIGDGAVIGAGCVVRGTVPPYAICTGNPGTVVRRRFDDDAIARLLRLRWWDWPDGTVDRYLPLILGPDIHRFLDAAEAEFGLAPLPPAVAPAPAPAPAEPAPAAEPPRAAPFGWLRGRPRHPATAATRG